MTVPSPAVVPPGRTAGLPLRVRPSARRRRWVPDVASLVVGVGLGASVALPVSQATAASLATAGAVTRLAGDVTAMAGTYLLLVMVLLAARIPALERVLGQERLLRLHRRLSSAPLVLLGLHGVLTTLGYAQSARRGFWPEAGSLVMTMAWIFAALVAYAMLVVIAAVSIRAVRRRLPYDTWWVIHLYTYLALAFSLLHQLVDGTSFVGHPLARAGWALLWLATAGVVTVYRLGLPVVRSLYHRLEVVQVGQEAPGVFSLLLHGRHLDRLPVAGGQYFGWRFLTRDLWWHAHPFSLSALPAPPYLRVTVKVAGDTTAAVARLSPGTKVAIEGPYGAFTDASRTRRKVALVGAGVGVTPLRALLEDLPAGVDVVMVQRASDAAGLVHHRELAQLVAARGGRMVPLAGPRRRYPLHDPRYLHWLVPDLAGRDLYVCGPERFSSELVAAARRIGVAADAIHVESFEL